MQIRKRLTVKTSVIPFCWGVTGQDGVLYLKDMDGGEYSLKQEDYHTSQTSHFIKHKLESAKNPSLILWPEGSI